jgi:cysteine desulfurase / selenocysteine lyase
MEFNQLADLFPITRDCIYLNNAGLSPLSTWSRTAMMNAIDWAVQSTFRQNEWQTHYERTRAKIAGLIHCEPIEIAFTRGTSEGISMILNGLNWSAEHNVVTYSDEHPTVRFNALRLSREFGVQIRVAGQKNGMPDADELISLIDRDTKVVLLSWVQYSTGFRSVLRPIGLCCRDHGALFVVDVVQGLGALELDVGWECIDACAAGANKFLLGPEGVGFIFVSRKSLDRVRPSAVGWRSVKYYGDLSADNFTYNDGALRFEYGTLNLAGVCGMEASLNLLGSLRPKEIETYLLDLASYLVKELQAKRYNIAVPGEPQSAIVSCAHKSKSASELVDLLRTKRIETSSRAGRLRISPHIYNTRGDIDALLRVIPE